MPSSQLPPVASTKVPGLRSYPDQPMLNGFMGSLWGTMEAVPDWPETADLSVGDWIYVTGRGLRGEGWVPLSVIESLACEVTPG